MYAVALRPGQLATLAGLRTLGDLDLELVRAGEVRGGDAEAGRRDLLDPRVVAPAVGARRVPGRILAALAGVRRAAGALDPDRQGLVRLGRQGADAHRRHDEATDDAPGVLDVRERRGDRGAADAQLVARDGAVGGAAGEGGAVAGKRGVDVGGGAVRGQRRDDRRDLRREEVRLAVGAEAGEARVGQARLAAGRGRGDGRRRDRAAELAGRQVGEGRPAGPRGGGREAARDDGRIEVDDVDERPADVRRDRADAHPGERLAQAGLEGARRAHRWPRPA